MGVLIVPAAMLPGDGMQLVCGVLEIHGPVIATQGTGAYRENYFERQATRQDF